MTKKPASKKQPTRGRMVKVVGDDEFTSKAEPASKIRRRNPAPASNVIQFMFGEIADTRARMLRTQEEIDRLSVETREALLRLKAA